MPLADEQIVYVQLRLDDVNLAGHVGNTAIARLIDEARMIFLGCPEPGRPGDRHGVLGVGVLGVLDGQVDRLVGQQTVEFHDELWYSREPVAVTLWVTHIGTSSFSLASTISTHLGHAPVVTSEATMVLVHRGTGAAWRIDDTVRGRLTRYLGDPVMLRPRPSQRPRS
ncbi:acyl-CoA thioesterase [Kocuria sp. CPCC 205263]|uniref:acyl-CoA thioesterase n=1 Tax=Kocuria sp. CPCC 205263 TaxID=3073555 RepID=UPI0034D3CC4E